MLSVFGNIENPFKWLAPASPNLINSQSGSGLIAIASNVVKLIIVIAGLYTFLNIILAGWQFLSAGGEPKNITKAWEKIWQSTLGLVIIAASFIIAGIIGYILFGPDNWNLLISPKIFTP